MRFRRKSVFVEAIRYTGDNQREVEALVGCNLYDFFSRKELPIETQEGHRLAVAGDWIIRGVKGECYLCKPDVFEETYEPEPISEALEAG